MPKEEKNLGIFKSLCDFCTHKSCCDCYDSAMLLPSDIKMIIHKTDKTREEEFCRKIKHNDKYIKVLKKKGNSTRCIFLDDKTKQCSIYSHRPFDCKMFPFDVNYIDNEYWWVIYSCNKTSDWSWTEDQLRELEQSVQFDEIMNHIDKYEIHTPFEISKSQDYGCKVIRKVVWTPKNNNSRKRNKNDID